MNKFIVAEISKSWTIGAPIADILSQRFEFVINANLARGYVLRDWRMSSITNGNVFTETIIAIFEES